MGNLRYYFSRMLKKIQGPAIKNSEFDKPSRCESGATVISSKFGRYSYCGYYCQIVNAEIGNFVSIADEVCIGLANHPMKWVSTSPAFYFGRDSLPKQLAQKDFNCFGKKSIIGNDVWIGHRAIIMPGITIGNGAVIGANAVVTKDVEPYAVVVGVPAKTIRKRFDDITIQKLQESEWWNLSNEALKKVSDKVDNVEEFLLALNRIKN